MRSQIIQRGTLTIALGAMLLMYGCAGDSGDTGSTASPLTGTWTRNFDGSIVTITLTDNGDYTVNMGSGTEADVRGRYTIENDQVTFVDEGGNNASTAGEAVYGFAIQDGQLTLTPIDEPDENRESVAAATWSRS